MTAPAKELTKSANLPSGDANSTFTDPDHTARCSIQWGRAFILAMPATDMELSTTPVDLRRFRYNGIRVSSFQERGSKVWHLARLGHSLSILSDLPLHSYA